MTKKRTAENEIVLSSGAAAKPARRKPSSRSRAKHPVPPETASTLSVGSEAAEETTLAVAGIVEPPVAAASRPSRDEIAQLAYLYWESRGCRDGSPESDWLRAEQELLARA
jgi:hypothetical protein